MLGLGPRNFPTKPPACYRTSATTSLALSVLAYGLRRLKLVGRTEQVV